MRVSILHYVRSAVPMRVRRTEPAIELFQKLHIKFWCETILKLQSPYYASIPDHEDMLTFGTVASIVVPSLGLQHNHAHPRSKFYFFLHHFFAQTIFRFNRPDHCTNQPRASASLMDTNKSVHGLSQLAYAALLLSFVRSLFSKTPQC